MTNILRVSTQRPFWNNYLVHRGLCSRLSGFKTKAKSLNRSIDLRQIDLNCHNVLFRGFRRLFQRENEL
jgi:hypothetical protein